MNNLTQVIAAVSTPPGKGGVAIIRMSGEGAFEIAERVFYPLSGKSFSEYPPRVQVYGHIVQSGEIIDDVLATRFPAPHSYTGEDTVEIGCHGGVLVTTLVLEALLSAGARAATAGEFTRRAFVGGRLSLTEAEAIADLLEAKSREQLRLSGGEARGRLSAKINEIRTSLVGLMSSIYARIDYPDEDLGDFSDAELATRLNNIKVECDALRATYSTGRAISEGILTVICGKPNAGKSSLYNLLLGEDAAIVTDIPGTTRDVLRSSLPLGRVMLNISDTAGIREICGMDAVERIGVAKSREMIAESELLFAIFDLSREFDEEDELILSAIRDTGAVKIALLNKADLPEKFDRGRLSYFDEVIEISARERGDEALAALSECVNRLFTDERLVTGQDAILSSARQHAALSRCTELVGAALDSLNLGFPQDAVSGDVERALGAISELDGRAVSEEIVSDIFAKFCVGK